MANLLHTSNLLNSETHEEYQYLNLIKRIMHSGDKRNGRNGATYSVFGEQMKFNLRNETIPILTTKQTAWKTCLKELLWFIQGHTDNKLLKEQNVHIWDDNGSREFLDSRGLVHNDVDDLGPIYGFQWKNFNGTYRKCNDFDNDGVDQLEYVINALRNDGSSPGENKYSRRLIVSAWNPCALNQMVLPPCHVLFQFYVNSDDELSCHLYQRSGDVGLGVPFNIASYSFLTHIIARHCGLKTGDFIYSLGDCHIYEQHIDALKTQIQRKPYEFPRVLISNDFDNLQSVSVNDIKIIDYKYHDKIKMKMIA